MSSKKSAPLPASSGGLMRFFEDETKGFRIDPKIVISIPIWFNSNFMGNRYLHSYVKKIMEKDPDGVSNIHNRFSLTLINPSSHYFSLVGSLAIAAVISLTTYFGYLSYLDNNEVWYRLPAVIGVLVLTQLLDTRFTRKKRIFKVITFLTFCKHVVGGDIVNGIISKFCSIKRNITFFCNIWYVSIC